MDVDGKTYRLARDATLGGLLLAIALGLYWPRDAKNDGGFYAAQSVDEEGRKAALRADALQAKLDKVIGAEDDLKEAVCAASARDQFMIKKPMGPC